MTKAAAILGMHRSTLWRKMQEFGIDKGFGKITELITTLMEAREDRQLVRLRGRLEKLDLLILDELGYVPASKVGAELLFDIISAAYGRTSIIVTTNLPFENWTEVLGSERLTGAVFDRLTHRCHIVEMTGESYRLKDAKRRRTGKNYQNNCSPPSGGALGINPNCSLKDDIDRTREEI